MTPRERLETVAAPLARRGLEECELFVKRGRTRCYELGAHGRQATTHREAGWALRASGPRSSLMIGGTGEPRADGGLPDPDGFPIPLPPATAPPDWRPPPSLEAPLIMESEALPLLEACERRLAREIPGARILRLLLEDGASEVELASTHGVEAAYRGRTASLTMEVVGPEPQRLYLAELFAEREARRFSPGALAERVANRLILERDGGRIERDRGEFLLAPGVAARILAGLQPLLVGERAAVRARELAGRGDRLAGKSVSIVDDGALAEGLFTAPVDGEGVPTRRQTLVEAGVFRRPLLAWWQQPPGAPLAGCLRRPGWREVPRLAPSHLFIAPDPATPVAGLLARVARGYYFTDALGRGLFDPDDNRFRLPVCGLQVRSGRAVRPVARAVLAGRLSALLQGVQAVGRDLAFVPAAGFVGSPSLLVGGVELDDSA